MPPRLAAVGASTFHQSGAGPSSRSSYEAAGADVTTNGPNGSTHPGLDEGDVDMLYLQPGAFKKKDRKRWQESGRTVGFGVSPVNGEIATWVTYQVCLYRVAILSG